jgi:hypothetical protein
MMRSCYGEEKSCRGGVAVEVARRAVAVIAATRGPRWRATGWGGTGGAPPIARLAVVEVDGPLRPPSMAREGALRAAASRVFAG